MKNIKLNDMSHIPTQFDIRSISTMILFEEAKEIARQSGAIMGGQIEQWIVSQLAGHKR